MDNLFLLRRKKKLIDKLNKNKFKEYFMIGTGVNALSENVELMKHSLSNGINRFLLMHQPIINTMMKELTLFMQMWFKKFQKAKLFYIILRDLVAINLVLKLWKN